VTTGAATQGKGKKQASAAAKAALKGVSFRHSQTFYNITNEE
jgi:hypothetical protein